MSVLHLQATCTASVGKACLALLLQGAERVKAAQQEAEAMKRETALAAAALEGRTQALARQEAAAAEAKALLAVRTKELDSREVHLCLLCYAHSSMRPGCNLRTVAQHTIENLCKFDEMSILKTLTFIQHLPVSLHAAETSNQLSLMHSGHHGRLFYQMAICQDLVGPHVSRARTVLTTLASDAGSHLQC